MAKVDSLLALGVEVDAADGARNLVEADVVEALEAGARDLAHAVVGHQEVLLPAHEDVLALGPVRQPEVRAARLLGQRPPGREAVPVVQVRLLRRAPRRVRGQEAVLAAHDLALEVGDEARVVLGEACVRQRHQRSVVRGGGRVRRRGVMALGERIPSMRR